MPASNDTAEAVLLTRLDALTRASEVIALQLFRLEQTVRSKVQAPVVSLSVAEAADRLGCSTTTITRLLGRGVFTDCRGGKRQGCPHRIFCDEIDTYRERGEDAVTEHRRLMGRL